MGSKNMHSDVDGSCVLFGSLPVRLPDLCGPELGRRRLALYPDHERSAKSRSRRGRAVRG